MTALQTPAADAPASEWGRLAVSIPGAPDIWLLAADGKGLVRVDRDEGLYGIASDGTWWEPTGRADRPWVLVVDHPATAGCFLALLGPCDIGRDATARMWSAEIPGVFRMGTTPGRAMIAAAAALGRWPGGGA